MTIQEWLEDTKHALVEAGGGTARLDAEVLLATVLKRDRSWLHAHASKKLDQKLIKELEAFTKRRSKNEPLAYILGTAEFYGRPFMVTDKVLIPRPETETMIDLLLELPPINAKTSIADVGCGSGAIGITALLQLPKLKKLSFIDIDADALAVAHRNSRLHKVKGDFYKGNLLEAHLIHYDILLCNLPYVPENYDINEAARHEPKIALFGGQDGLDIYRQLFTQINTGLYGNPLILAESMPEQHKILSEIAWRVGYKTIKTKDYIQVFRRVIV